MKNDSIKSRFRKIFLGFYPDRIRSENLARAKVAKTHLRFFSIFYFKSVRNNNVDDPLEFSLILCPILNSEILKSTGVFFYFHVKLIKKNESPSVEASECREKEVFNRHCTRKIASETH